MGKDNQDKPPEKTKEEQVVVKTEDYQKPAFRCERVFETMALACGKVHPTQQQCHFNRKNS
jgi:hypothetical protein